MSGGRPKGIAKTGGRQKGTPNKVTTPTKEWLGSLLENKREQFEEYLDNLEPNEFIKVYSNLLSYHIPKMNSVNIDAQINAEMNALTRLLETAPEEAVDKIADRMLELQEMKADE